MQAGWADAFGVFRSPAIGTIVLLGVVLLMMFLFWLVLSNAVYNLTLGPAAAGVGAAALSTTMFSIPHAGRTMALVGIGTGLYVRGGRADHQRGVVSDAAGP